MKLCKINFDYKRKVAGHRWLRLILDEFFRRRTSPADSVVYIKLLLNAFLLRLNHPQDERIKILFGVIRVRFRPQTV
jgi:hypothetical protein